LNFLLKGKMFLIIPSIIFQSLINVGSTEGWSFNFTNVRQFEILKILISGPAQVNSAARCYITDPKRSNLVASPPGSEAGGRGARAHWCATLSPPDQLTDSRRCRCAGPTTNCPPSSAYKRTSCGYNSPFRPSFSPNTEKHRPPPLAAV
jgi:hypothetical protein